MKIYNTITRQKEEFTPKEQTIKIYTCGQTVYNDIHIGNARFYVIFDTLRRLLKYLYPNCEIKFVQNFTDIDDKIIQRAEEEHRTATEIAEKYITRTLEDLKDLNVEPATVAPCATQEIEEIKAMVVELINKGFAYENNGTVYYSVSSFLEYGKLSKKNLDELKAGVRIEVEENKRDPMDFVLWKPSKSETEPAWDSPWGKGRPGWHIECSAMVRKYLGDEIDIHGGATDLIFPHHENEIAQTEALTGKSFSRFWMHCGILTKEHKKISKSRGNFETFREVKERFPADVIRFYLLSGHYRMPLEFTDESLKAAQAGLTRIKTCVKNLKHSMKQKPNQNFAINDFAPLEYYKNRFLEAMCDDFNTADAISTIFDMVKFINIMEQEEEKNNDPLLNYSPLPEFSFASLEMVKFLMGLLGIDCEEQQKEKEEQDNSEIESLINQRQEARKNKDFVEADRIREQLTEMGITIEDTREGIRWHRV